MENNKGQTIFLSVIGIATLLVAIVGATFAWFSTTVTGSAAEAEVTTATIGNVTFTGFQFTAAENILPGWVWTPEPGQRDTFGVSAPSITGSATVGYTCSATVNNTTAGGGSVTDFQYRITTSETIDATGDQRGESTVTDWATVASGQVTHGTLTATNTSDTYKIEFRFRETGEDQNEQQTGTVSVTVMCAIAGTNVYYNSGNASGTTEEPAAQ